MTTNEHIEKHKELHRALDELIADYILTTKKGLQNTNLLQLIEWSHEQTIKPTEQIHGTVQ